MDIKRGEGIKNDAGKLRMDLVPMRAHEEFVAVLTHAVNKYAANNWRSVIGWRWRYAGAALRHIIRYCLGEARDPEWNRHHLAHALCCLYFVLNNELSLEAGEVVPDGNAEANDRHADHGRETIGPVDSKCPRCLKEVPCELHATGGPDDSDCTCRGTPKQDECALSGCGFCRADNLKRYAWPRPKAVA